jgi:hypothetical protein
LAWDWFSPSAQRRPAGNVFQVTLFNPMLRPGWVNTQSAQRHLESAFSAISACFPLCGLCVNLGLGLFLAKRAKTACWQRVPGNIL